MPTWTGVGSGGVLRAVRLHRRQRQSDVAVSGGRQPVHVSRAEHGRLDRALVRATRSRSRPSWTSSSSLMPAGTPATWTGSSTVPTHRSSKQVVRELRRSAGRWSSNSGSTTTGTEGRWMCWRGTPATRTLLIVEVKSILTDLQATFTSFAPRCAIVPMLAAPGPRLGRHGQSVDSLSCREPRRIAPRGAPPGDLRRRAAGPDARDSARGSGDPNGSLAGLWFLSSIPTGTATNVIRVRRWPPRAATPRRACTRRSAAKPYRTDLRA